MKDEIFNFQLEIERFQLGVDTIANYPIVLKSFVPGLDQSMVDHSTEEWLDKIEDRLNYKDWFCGHWHIDKRIDKMHFMMRSVEAL
jgi:hypothetical protein